MARFKAIITNSLDNNVGTSIIEAKDIEQAYEVVDTISHNYDEWKLFDEKRWQNLLKAINQKEENIPVNRASEILV